MAATISKAPAFLQVPPSAGPRESVPSSAEVPAHGQDERDPLDLWGERRDSVGLRMLPSRRAAAPGDTLRPAPGAPIALAGGGTVQVEPAPASTAMFRNEKGWIGGDGDYSIVLDDHRILWLFGDTLLGEVAQGKRAPGWELVNNTFGLQTGKDPATASMDFYAGASADGRFTSVLAPDDGQGWFWPYSGVEAHGALDLFLIRIDRDDSPLGFKTTGMSVAHVDNPQDPPARWTFEQSDLPWNSQSPEGGIFFGSTVLTHEGFAYVYGIRDVVTEGIVEKHMVVARVPSDSVRDFGRWEFFDGRGWGSDFREAASLAGHFANEYTVSYQPALGRFVAVYTVDGASPHIALRTAERPEGPWSEATVIYRCPETEWHPNVLTYAAKAHPALSGSPAELMTSYIVNSMQSGDLIEDARHYWPQFLKLTFQSEG